MSKSFVPRNFLDSSIDLFSQNEVDGSISTVRFSGTVLIICGLLFCIVMNYLILHGRRSIELQKLRHLIVPLQNAIFFSSAVRPGDSRKTKSCTVSYLADSLGLTTKLAESISRKASVKDKGNLDSVLSLLRSHRFSDLRYYYRLSTIAYSRTQKSLSSKLKFLHFRGASTSELTQMVSKVPQILGKKEDQSISLYYDFVKDILANKSSSYYLPQDSKHEDKIRNVSALRELGVPQRLLLPVHGKEKFEESLNKVVEMGFDPTISRFVKALHVFYQMSDTSIEEKVEVYKKLGISVGEIWAIFKKWPFSLKIWEKKITQTCETLKKCGLSETEVLSVLKSNPQFICTSEQKVLNSIETFIGLEFSRDEVAMMVKRYPALIGLSAETVKKKTNFL